MLSCDVRPQGVAKNFREIFAELAPGGKAELIMQKRLPGAAPAENPAEGAGEEDGEDDDEAEGGGIAEKYAGVKVKVRRRPGVWSDVQPGHGQELLHVCTTPYEGWHPASNVILRGQSAVAEGTEWRADGRWSTGTLALKDLL